MFGADPSRTRIRKLVETLLRIPGQRKLSLVLQGHVLWYCRCWGSFRQSWGCLPVFHNFRGIQIFFNPCSTFRFGRKLSIIRGIVEQEIQAMVSKRENIATHHLYQEWDPVPSLSPATTGTCGERGRLSLGQDERLRPAY